MPNSQIQKGASLESSTWKVHVFSAITLASIAFYGPSSWLVTLSARAFILAALIWPSTLRSKAAWYVVGLAYLVAIAANWPPVDNHEYLMGYSAGLAFIANSLRPSLSAEYVLRTSATWLVVITMSLSVGQKIGAPDFLSGTFFEHAIATDVRFRVLARVSGLHSIDLDQNKQRMSDLRHERSTVVTLESTPSVTRLARILSAVDLALPTIIALTLALPTSRIRAIGFLALSIFIGTTYLVAPVVGFGFVLCALGYAACDSAEPRENPWQQVFLGLLILLLLASTPWVNLFD